MSAEAPNLYAAAEHALDNNLPAITLTIAAAVHGYLRTRGQSDHALAFHRAGLKGAQLMRDPLAEASALTDLGDAERLFGTWSEAIDDLTRAVEDRLGEANTLNHIGALNDLTADYPAAMASQERALALFRELSWPFGEANAASEVGLVQRRTGDYRGAAQSQARALELARTLGYRGGEADALAEL